MKVEIPVEQAHRLLAPRVACLLTTRYHGQVNVMALSWTGPISLTPPLLLMAIHPSTYTHDMLRRSQECVLNIPGRPLAEQTVRCGTLSGADVDKIQVTGMAPGVGPPRAGAVARGLLGPSGVWHRRRDHAWRS